LGALRRLRILEIRAKHVESLAALGSLTQLERLSLESSLGHNESSEFLVGLTKLRSLTLKIYHAEGELEEEEADDDEEAEERKGEEDANEVEADDEGTVEREAVEWLAAVGKLPELERLELGGSFSSDDLTHLSGSRNLKTLTVDTVAFDGFANRRARTCLAAV